MFVTIAIVAASGLLFWGIYYMPPEPHPDTEVLLIHTRNNIAVYAWNNQCRLPSRLTDLLGTIVEGNNPDVFRDGWGKMIRYTADGKIVTLRSSGPDRRLFSSDDLTLEFDVDVQCGPKETRESPKL